MNLNCISGWSHARVHATGGQLYTRICDLCEILIWDGPRPWAMGPAAPELSHAIQPSPSSRPLMVYARLCLSDARPGPV